MSTSKANVIEKLNLIPDDLDETQIVERLYMLLRLERSRQLCEEDGTYSDQDFINHFNKKKDDIVAKKGECNCSEP